MKEGLLKKLNKWKATSKYAGNLIYSIIAIIVIFAVLFSASFAWFTMNRDVSATGIKMSVEAVSNLVISTLNSDTEGGIASESAPNTITFTTAASLNPATHDGDYTAYTTGLKYVVNLEDVSSTTGYADEYTYDDAANTDKKSYYIDRVVYVASRFTAVEDIEALNLEITDISEFSNTAFNAASMDIYAIPNVTIEDSQPAAEEKYYVGTLNIAGEKADDENTYVVDLLKNEEVKAVPLNTEKSICIIMRCYFDGALESETEGTAYVTTNVVSTLTTAENNLSFGIKISAVIPEED